MHTIAGNAFPHATNRRAIGENTFLRDVKKLTPDQNRRVVSLWMHFDARPGAHTVDGNAFSQPTDMRDRRKRISEREETSF